MSNTFFTRAKANLDAFRTGTVKAKLEKSSSTYTPNVDHDFRADLTGFVEYDGSGYTEQTLANKSIEYDDTNNRIEFHCDPLAFGTLLAGGGNVVRGIVFYLDTGNAATDVLLCYVDTLTGTISLPFTANGSPLTININAEGLVQIS